MSALDQVVFIVENGQITETKIRDFAGSYIDETTTPHGVGPRFHVRGTEVWSWGHQGNCPHLVATCETEAEAVEALEETYAYDFWANADILAFKERAAAEAALAGAL